MTIVDSSTPEGVALEVEVERASAGRQQPSWLGDEAVVVSATGVVSIVNYAFTLVMLWLLPTREFSEVASVSALLLIAGTVAGAALPWVLAQEVVRSGADRARRRSAVSFCVVATVLQGAAAGLAACLIAVHYTNSAVLAATFCSVLFIFMAATATGYLQGLHRFRLIAALKVAEAAVKIGAGVGLVALGAGAGGAIAGFALGAGVVAGAGLILMARDLRLSWSALSGHGLWASTQGLLAIQAGVAVLASLDVVIGSLVLGTTRAFATYQAANILGRVPVFIGTALSVVVFTRMITVHRTESVIRESVGLYIKVCVPLTLITASLPPQILTAVFPARYGDVGAVLPWTALAGLVMGAVNLATTYFQAAGRYRRVAMLLGAGVLVAAPLDVLGLKTHGTIGLAVAVAIGAALVTVALAYEIRSVWRGSLRGALRTLMFVSSCCLPLLVLRGHLVGWVLWAIGCGALFCVRGLLDASRNGSAATGAVRPRVLHLGYEDPKRPGAGGGSVRTYEVNRRLSERFDITVVCARYRGCRSRTEDGVRYVHAGLAAGDFPSRLAYFAALPWTLFRYRSDLVVEDFGAPFSTVALPWLTARPVLGLVQWLFAAEKSRQYHLPFAWVERVGVRSHRRMVAMSSDLADQLETRNPRATVTVIANGLDPGAFETYDCSRSGIAYLGRLEIAQKGLDLLIESYARVADDLEQDLIIGGDGPDHDALVHLADRLGVGDRVRFVGRVPAGERFAWLAAAQMVAMPSRYETFGMVAAEALAVGTPVVAFDIPCLRGLVDDQVGARVPAFDLDAFAEQLRVLASNPEVRCRLGRAGPERVVHLNWDDLACRQGDVYGELLDGALELAGQGSWDEGVTREAAVVPSPQSKGCTPPSVISLFCAQCAASPNLPAIGDGDVVWTYGQLRDAAGRVAGALLGQGIGSGDAVAVCLPRSGEAIAAMLGIWGSGAAYVPLDPQYPRARLASMAERAGVNVVLGRAGQCDRLGSSLEVLDVEAIVRRDDKNSMGAPAPLRAPTPTDLAYILFTSGSSGRPKAVQVPHRGLSSVLEWIRGTLSAEEMAVSVTSISFSFDAFILEVLGPLVHGGMVQVVQGALAVDADAGATFMANTPSVLSELYHAGRLPRTILTLISGGEVLSPSLASELLGQTPARRLINTYGPTETTLLVTAHEVVPPFHGQVPIGRDLPGATVVLLDEKGREVAPGAIGEICIHGPQVADGYRGDPGETEERFRLWPTADGRLVRLYRSGDLACRNQEGALEFQGRRDRQLKVRGYRVEPGEVEAVIGRYPGVTGTVVDAVGRGSDARLRAHVAGDPARVSPATLRAWLKEVLPSHLVPAHVTVMDAFPTTLHGKVDMDRLTAAIPVAVGLDPAGPSAHDVVSPDGRHHSNTEDIVARLAGEVLGYHGAIRTKDDFVDDLGGSSLALFRLLTLMEREFASSVEIGRVVEDTTIAGLAGLVASSGGGPGSLTVHGDGSRTPLYLVHTYLGSLLRYRRLGQHLSHERPMVGIQVQHFDGPSGPRRDSVAAMADDAVAQIRSHQSDGPYLLGGHSAGGVVAYEAARRLLEAGTDVPLVLLIDTPLTRSPWRYLWAEVVLNWPDLRVASGRELVARHLGDLVGHRWNRHRPSPVVDRVGTTIARAHRASNLAVRRYKPEPYGGDVAVIRTGQGQLMALGRDDLGWGTVVRGRVTTAKVSGLHNTLFEDPHLAGLAGAIDVILESADVAGSVSRSRFPHTPHERSARGIGDREDHPLLRRRPRLLAGHETHIP